METPLTPTYSLKRINGHLLELFKDLELFFNKKENSFVECQAMTNRIDFILLQLAQITINLKTTEPIEVSQMKEFSWRLLEDLESYCNKKFKESIW